MLLRKFLALRKAEPEANSPEEKEDVPAEKSEHPTKHSDANVVYPFHDAKTTSFSPPLSQDAAVFTDPQTVAPTPFESQKERVSQDKSAKEDTQADKNGKEDIQTEEKEKKDEVKAETAILSTEKDDTKLYLNANGICDLKSCTMEEKCSPETCERASTKSGEKDAKEMISRTKLTEMINSSIKEAMQIIVKQCRMQDAEKDLDRKPNEELDKKSANEELDKSICYVKTEVIPVKVKHEHRPRTTQEQLNNRSRISKTSRLERYNSRPCSKKLRDENTKSRSKKSGNLSEEVRNKRHSKSANNVKTDNRKMTGNVNIYICSEATDNIQTASKSKKSAPCTESSSETTTEQSKISSSKLVTCIRNKRRKSKEQDSLDFLAKKEESSENSTTCSCVSKYTDTKSATRLESSNSIIVCNDIDKEICVQSTESTLSDCECNAINISSAVVAIDKSDSSFERSKFVMCDKIEKPCSTIYPTKSLSNSESEGWSTKSTVCSDCIPSDTWSLEPNLTYRSSESESRRFSTKTLESVCRYNKKDRESVSRYSVRCNCRAKRRSSRIASKEPFLICNCIMEEGEGDICVDAKTSQDSAKPLEKEKEKVTICQSQKSSVCKKLEEPVEYVPCAKDSAEFTKDMKSLERVEKEKEVEKQETPKIEEEEKHKKLSVAQEAEKEAKEVPPKIPRLGGRRKLIRPETLVLKNILQQQAKVEPRIDRKSVSPVALEKADASEQPLKGGINSKDKTQVSPNILKKFNLRTPYRNMVKQGTEEKPAAVQEKEEKELEKKNKTLEKESEDKGDTKNFQEKLRSSFLFKGLKKIVGRTERSESKSEGSTEKDKIGDINVDKPAEIPEAEVEKSQTPVKSKSETKEKFIPSKLYSYIPIKMKRGKPETNAVASTNVSANAESKKNKNNPTNDPSVANNPTNNPSVANNPTSNPSPRKSTKEEVVSDVNKEQQSKSKLTAIGKKSSPVLPTQRDTGKELTEQKNSAKQLNISAPREVKDIKDGESQEALKKAQERKPEIREERRGPEIKKLTTREDKPAKKMHVDEQFERETVCTQPHKMESHTICTNASSKYAKYARLDERFANEESTCNCCRLSASQYSNEPITGYPKSCLKKERQCCRNDSQENSFSVPYRDKRNWEECGCRRSTVCGSCRRPKNECSCRRTITCAKCYKPKNKCVCKPIHEAKGTHGCMKSMFCLYCDNPRERCTCRAPLRKCSCCELSVDLCMCKEQQICDGRPVLSEPENDRTMYVTAWKPREEVRRYFSRNLADLRTDCTNECCCCEKLKSRNSDDLPYQRLSVFSDVMDELQQKMSESMCCTRCKKIPCCCNVVTERDEGREERKIKYCISPKTRRKIIAVCLEKSRNKLANNCKCESSQTKSDKQKKIVVTLCCACKATPCRCNKSKSNSKKPKAKCYYCKSSPCVCTAARERNKSRPCRCTDSPCRSKEKESTTCGKTSTKPKNNDEKTICVR